MENSNSQTNFTIKATIDQVNEMLTYYQGYISYNTNTYIIAKAKLANVTITFYKTNSVLFQGNDSGEEYNFWAEKFNLEKVIITSPEEKNQFATLSIVGSDEVGTGDYFGPIVVCATYVNKDNIVELRKLGVKDSKLLTDRQMIPLAMKIGELIPYTILMLSPERFNSLKDSEDNMNYVKAVLHNNAINSILKKVANCKIDAILVDKFTTEKTYYEYLKNSKNPVIDVTLIEKGEYAHIGVAAASILARVTFLKELKKMSNLYDIEFLKGAGHEVDRTATSFIKSYGLNELKKVAKIKFKNTERVLEYLKSKNIEIKK